jgi:carbamate kinase
VLGIDELLILTAVPRIAVNFGKPTQKELDEVKLDELKAYHREGHFPPGSMGPKVDAAIRFLEGGGKRAIISHLTYAMPALRGETGTHVVH